MYKIIFSNAINFDQIINKTTLLFLLEAFLPTCFKPYPPSYIDINYERVIAPLVTLIRTTIQSVQ